MSEFELLDHLLKYLFENRGYRTMNVISDDILEDNPKDEDVSNLNSAILKLVKDEYVLEDMKTHTQDSLFGGTNTYTVYGYSISFEGIIFYQTGGYRTSFEKSETENNNLKALQTRQQKLEDRTFWLTVLITIGTLFAAFAAIVQVLDYFGVEGHSEPEKNVNVELIKPDSKKP